MDNKQYTVKDLVKFVLRHRKDKVFIDCSVNQIYGMIVDGIQKNTIIYCVDKHENICGLGYGVANSATKIFFVWNLITTNSTALQAIFAKWCQLWPNYCLQAHRRGKLVKYNLQRLSHKLQ